MRAYQFEKTFSANHQALIELPPDAPEGQAQVIVLFPDAQAAHIAVKPRFANMTEFAVWLQTQPPTGRSAEEVEQHIREERASWN